jgi:hypothetical protein
MRKVLIVTQELLAGLPTSFLDRRNLRIRTADSVEEAARMAEAWRPDLVIAAGHCAAAARGLAPSLLSIGPTPEGVGADATMPAGSDIESTLARVSELLDLPTRVAPRLPADFMARITARSGATWLAHIVELSGTGLLLECEGAGTLQGEVIVEFHLPARAEPVAAKARVVSIDLGHGRVAVALVDDGGADRAAIVDYVDVQTRARADISRKVTEDSTR